MKKLDNSKKIFIGIILLVVLMAGFGFAYKSFVVTPSSTNTTVASNHNLNKITFDVVVGENVVNSYEIETDKPYLGEALSSFSDIELDGTTSEYGLFVTEINGIKADDSKKEWWAFKKDGEMLQTGVDSTPIENGAKYEAVLTVGY